MGKRQTIVIAGYYGAGNAGDELILKCLVDRFRRLDPAAPLVVLSANPDQTRAVTGVEAVSRWNPVAWIKPMLNAKTFILGGGGLLQESTSRLNHAYYLGLVLFARALGCATETVAIGVDPMRSVFNQMLTRFVFNHALDRIQVRDKGSLRLLRSFGVDRTIDVQPDVVWDRVIQPVEPAVPSRIAVIPTAWPARVGWDQDLALFCTQLSQRLQRPVDLIPFFPAQDNALALAVQRRAKVPVEIRAWKHPEDLLEWIPSYSLVVSMRYHGVLLAAKAGVPLVAWGNQPKVRQLCVENNYPLWDFDRGWALDNVLRHVMDAGQRPAAPVRASRQPVLAGGSRPAGKVIYSAGLR